MSEPVGRPLKYKTAEEMQAGIDEYFDIHSPIPMKDASGKPYIDNKGNEMYDLNPPTLSGLALHLGFADRQSMYDYQNRNDEFSCTIRKARSRCEQWVEINGLKGNTPPAMAIFALKNYGWTDKPEKQETDDTANDLSILQQALGIDTRN